VDGAAPSAEPRRRCDWGGRTCLGRSRVRKRRMNQNYSERRFFGPGFWRLSTRPSFFSKRF